MVEIARTEQFKEVEAYSDEVQGNEIQIIDTITTQVQQEKEDKNDQSISVACLGPQDVDKTIVQDEDGENPRLEINLQSSEQTSSLASLALAYMEKSEQWPN